MPSHVSKEVSSEYPVWPEGKYRFTVIDAKETVSKSPAKNPMIDLVLEFTDGNGRTIKVYDHLVFVEGGGKRIDQFRAATGDTVVPGEVIEIEDSDCRNREGIAHLFIDTWEGKKRNKVKYYVVPAKGGAAVPAAETAKQVTADDPF